MASVERVCAGEAAGRFAGVKAAVCVVMAFVAAPVAAAEGEWETLSQEPWIIKARSVPGTDVKEIWAEGVLDAPVADIQSAVGDPDNYTKFMPYVKEARKVGAPHADGGQLIYTRLDFGRLVKSRDYVVISWLDKGVDENGDGEFKNHWKAAPDALPERANALRVRVNEGSWHVTPRKDGKSDVVYRFLVDPGGMIPRFAADIGNREGVSRTLKAVEQEAQRRHTARTRAAGK